MTTLIPPKNPNSPVAPTQYDARYQDQLSSVLRLYFNTIDNGLGSLYGPNGGQYINNPHIAASDSTDQYATAANTPTVVNWNTMSTGSGFTLNAPGSATADVAGVYKITYSAQLANTDNAAHDAVFWLRVNGTDVADSATIFTIVARKSAGVPSYVCGYSEAVFTVQAGDVVELIWATDAAATSGGALGVHIFQDPAITLPYVRPAVPSVIGSITFVSSVAA